MDKKIESLSDDRFLIEAIRKSDQFVFEMIFMHYYSGLVVYADRIVKNLEISEDIVQSIFLRFWEGREEIEIRSIRNYLLQSVKNRCIDHLRSLEIRNRYANRTLGQNLHEAGEDFFVKSELQQMVETSLDKLPSRCREIFIMSRFENLKMAEIADKLNLSKRTVETQISKALKILRVELKDYLTLIFLYFFH